MRGVRLLVAVSMFVGAARLASAQPMTTARVYEEESGPALAVELERGIAEALNADGRVKFRPYVDILSPRDEAVKKIGEAQKLVVEADKAWDELNIPTCKELLDKALDLYAKNLPALVERPDGLKPIHDVLVRLARTRFLDADPPGAREALRQLYALRGSLAKDLFPPQMKKLVTEARLLFETLGLAHVNLESDPPGAEIYFDGVRQAGVTPLELADVMPGPHIVTFVRRGYAPTTATVDARGNGEKTPLFYTLERYPGKPLAPLDRARLHLDAPEPPLAELREGATNLQTDVLLLMRVGKRDQEGGAAVRVLTGFLYDRRANKLVATLERESSDADLVSTARSLARDLLTDLSPNGQYAPAKPEKIKKKKRPDKNKQPNLNLVQKPSGESASDGVPWYKKKLTWYIAGGVGGAVVLSIVIGASAGAAHNARQRHLAADVAILGGN